MRCEDGNEKYKSAGRFSDGGKGGKGTDLALTIHSTKHGMRIKRTCDPDRPNGLLSIALHARLRLYAKKISG
jgi:hypothetical protein